MFNLKKVQVNRLADEANFNRNTTEKVLRLYSILDFLNKDDLEGLLALKGGTAINLFLLNLPRLSVDIDLDFNLPLEREEMLEKRKMIDRKIRDFMADEGYYLSDKSKFVHTLDSYVYSYTTTSGGRDVLKIEVNYSDRVHVLKSILSESTEKLGRNVTALRLSDDELIGSKVNALIVRTTPRDVYDVYTLFENGKIKDEALIRKIAVFYVCLGSEIPVDFDMMLETALKKINDLDFQKIKETLIPVLHKGIVFDVKNMSNLVSNKLKAFFVLDENDKAFIKEYNSRNFRPDILFDGCAVNELTNHPMGIWKTK